jgi:hypothetical protein
MKETSSDYFPSRFLKASDIKGDQPATVTEIKEETIGDDTKLVIYFDEFEKGLVANKTNAGRIGKIVGSERLKDWIGHTLILYVVNVTYKGEEVPAIRVKPPSQKI